MQGRTSSRAGIVAALLIAAGFAAGTVVAAGGRADRLHRQGPCPLETHVAEVEAVVPTGLARRSS